MLTVARLFGLLALFVGCAVEAPPPEASESPSGSSESSDVVAIDPRPVVVFLGDSLTAGFGLSEEQAYPALIATRLAAEGRDVRVVNAGLSGDTTAGGLRRLDWLLSQEPDVVMVALGGNDGLRALALESTEANLRAIIEQSREVGAVVVLAGMLIPPNYGPEYTEAFAAIYPRLADEYEVVFIPFLLEGVAADPELNLPDGIHPNVAGQKILAETVYPVIESALSGNG